MNLKNLIGDLFGFTQDIYQLPDTYQVKYRDIYDVSESQLANTKINLSKEEEKNVKLKSQIELLAKQYENLENKLKEDLDWLTEKDSKIQVLYQITEKDKKYNIDIHNFLCEYDSTLPLIIGVSNDDKALNCLNYIKNNITYTSDFVQYGETEFWAKTYQTLENKKGDCEDGAILLWNILLKAGVPWQRVRLCCGSVAGGGHAYITYCRETDDEWVVLDWCYWYSPKKIADRPTHKEERNYMNEEKNYHVWFSVDKKFGYARQKLTSISAGGEKFIIK